MQPILSKRMVKTLDSTLVVLDQLAVGQYESAFRLDAQFLSSQEATELIGGEVEAHAELTLRQTDFDLRMTVSGNVQVACDRCLEPMNLEVNARELMEIEPGARELDLMWLAYELIIVNLPLTHCHQEGECNPQMQALLQTHLCSAAPEEPEKQ